MPITKSIGYGGTVDEVADAQRSRFHGAEYGVGGVGAVGDAGYVAHGDAWRTRVVDGAILTVQVGLGLGYGHNVVDEIATSPVAAPQFPSTAGYHLVVARRTWAGAGGATTIAHIPATAAGDIPANRAKNPGVLDEQPLAMVRVLSGQTVPVITDDLRVWYANGGLVAASEKVLQFLTRPGTQVRIGSVVWSRSSGGVWSRQDLGAAPLFGVGNTLVGGTPSADAAFLHQAGSQVVSSDNLGYVRLRFPRAFPRGVVHVDVKNGDVITSPGLVLTPGYQAGPAYSLADVVYRTTDANGNLRATQFHRVNWTATGW